MPWARIVHRRVLSGSAMAKFLGTNSPSTIGTTAATAMARTAEPMVAPDGAKVVCHPAQANWGWPGHAGCPVGEEIMSPKFQPYPNHTYRLRQINIEIVFAKI